MDDFAKDHIGFLLRLPFGSLHDGHEATIDGVIEGATLEGHETGPRGSRNENEWTEALICFATCAGIQARWSSRKPLKAVKSLATMGRES